MKQSKKSKRISRTVIPSNPLKHVPHNLDLQYFNKTQATLKILEEKPQRQQKNQKIPVFDKIDRNILSQRLVQLCKTKKSHHYNISSKTINFQLTKPHHKQPRTARTLSKKDEQQYNLQLSNINKTINGTRLGALSAFSIMQELNLQYAKNYEQKRQSTSKVLKRLDSDVVQELNQNSVALQLPRVRKLSQMYKKKSKIVGPKTQQRLFEMIYNNDDSFIDKNREYQILLMQRIPSYKSRHLTLDYKNDWKI